jgi:xanthine dehydrogenase accessory factor
MTDFENILPLWRALESAGSDYVLATVVDVDGPSYRKPGARMLIAPDGRRAGTVSGGCLESEVAKRAWWLTESGPVVERYSTADDDGDMPYGSGCGGVVFILLERRATAAPLLTALEAAFHARVPLAIATVLEGHASAHRVFAGPTVRDSENETCEETRKTLLSNLAAKSLDRMQSIDQRVVIDGVETRVWVDYRAARPGLWIFGAGDDARPLLHLARQLGWFAAIADGRSHLATHERFPAADNVLALRAGFADSRCTSLARFPARISWRTWPAAQNPRGSRRVSPAASAREPRRTGRAMARTTARTHGPRSGR